MCRYNQTTLFNLEHSRVRVCYGEYSDSSMYHCADLETWLSFSYAVVSVTSNSSSSSSPLVQPLFYKSRITIEGGKFDLIIIHCISVSLLKFIFYCVNAVLESTARLVRLQNICGAFSLPRTTNTADTGRGSLPFRNTKRDIRRAMWLYLSELYGNFISEFLELSRLIYVWVCGIFEYPAKGTV